MDYALILSVSLYLCGCFYLFFGIYAIYANIRSKVNRMFFYLTAALGIWAFCDSIVNSASSAEVSSFWRAFSVFGWGVFYAILLHFIIIVINNKTLLSKPRTHFLIYAPALINIILFAPFGFLHQYQNRMAKSEYGWINAAPPGFVRIWLVLYFAIYSLTGIFLLLSWWKKIKQDKFIKRHLIYFLLSVILPSTVGILSNILPNIPFRFFLLKTFIFFNMIPTITLFTALKRYGIFHEKEKTVYVFHEGEIEGQSSRLRLFETTSIIFLFGSFVSFLIGHFFMKKPLNEEIVLSASVFIIALVSKYIPYMAKKHSVQNALFLVICMFGMVLYTLNAADIGGLTTWTVYIIFLLFTVVLGTRVHALIYTIFVILIQVIIWILYPEIAVVIDGNQYAVRIGIIILSLFSIRYVTKEYTSKENEYKRFAQEQLVLEKISTSFIAINSVNVTDKIQEMFKMSLEVLNFNHAYLVEFDNDYVDAKIIDTFVNNPDSESFPLTPDMTVKVADFPVFEPLIKDNKPIMCEDINKISLSEGQEQREFFSSRGINSYFAIPVIMDDNLISMLVIEYFDKSDVYSTENRLFFLKILANMLADSKKKILYEEKLYNFAYFDETTKLANRNMLNRNLENLIQDRKETDRFAVFNIELDNLRTINDTFGHAVGEKVVIKSVEILSELLNNCCFISRVTEEKFIVVSPACSDMNKIEERAKKIIESFKHPILLPGLDIEALFVIVNIGIAVFPEDGRDTDTLLKNSDLANFEAASTDERIVFCSDQLKDRVEQNTLMTHKLFRSLQNQEFSLEFQPQVSCSSSKTVGIEALLRWTTSDKKRIPPDKFIPILEQTGLIHEVGLWVLDQALLEHNRLIKNGFPPLRVSVNLSVVQFRREDFVDNVIKLIEKHRVDPKYIELEITESMLSQNFTDTIDKLVQLKKSGLNIAVDDFGKGYSSLHRLILIPFDRIKIDKTIIDNITSEKKSANIAKIIITLAKTLKADITAEGVETSEQAHFVRDIACDEIQGYYYSRPLPAEALEKFLKEYTVQGAEDENMKYALVLSILLYLFGCFYLIFGIYALFANVKSRVNRLFYYLTSCLAIFAFSYSISNSASTEEASTFWRACAAFGWGAYFSIFTHLILIITNNKRLLNNRLVMFLNYAPALINVILFSPYSPLKEPVYNMSQSRYGWINYMPSNILSIGIAVYVISYSILGAWIIASWLKKNKHETFLKRQLIFYLISLSVPLTIAIVSIVLPNILVKHLLHKLLIVSLFAPIIVLFLSLKKYGLFIERGKSLYVFQQGILDSEGSRIRLFETTAIVFIIGSALSFFTGYFSMGKDLESELFLAALVFMIGIFTRFIPFIAKDNIIQNGLYLSVCIAGMLYYTFITTETGGLTTWSVYIIFLLYSVILDTPIHALVFTAFVVILQIIFWIISPKIIVTLNGGEYLRRIIIIVLAAFSVRYLRTEFAAKESQYKRFAREQQVLEKISTGFLSLNKENAEEKLYEMFEMSYELLDFNHAYLVDFDLDYQNVTIDNTFLNVSDEKKSFPFNQGMRVAVSDFPVAKTIIKYRQPVMCDDVNKIRMDMHEELRQYFKSRDITSYFALPIFVDKDLRGMLVIEYYEKIDVHLRENRLYFLMIIANILGDARQKNLNEEKLYNYAYFDQVTKLQNRNMLRKNLEQLLQNVEETDRIAVFNIELDNLRMINDTFGHNVGVQIVLKSVDIMKSLMRECCIISRVAEGKFVLVMPTTETNEQLGERARRIIESFTHPILLPDLDIEALFVMVSVGISLYPEDGNDPDMLIKNADLAGYEAKSVDQKIVFSSAQLKDRVEENTLMTHKLFQALQNNEFSLEFQPQISCDSTKTVGIEALLRWTTSDNMRIPPDKFIPILEQTGLIHDVGLWVLDQALIEHNRLITNGFPPIRVSVNLSTVQFSRDDFVQNVAYLIRKHGVNPKYVELEITESMLAKNFADTIDKLHQLKKLGVKIAVDDFGKGYSSLHRLVLVPLDRIKIDKSIIDDITSESKKADIVKIIITLGKTLMVDITAEGVETMDQADFMKNISCDEIQGYYYSRPLKTGPLEDYLKTNGVEVLN